MYSEREWREYVLLVQFDDDNNDILTYHGISEI